MEWPWNFSAAHLWCSRSAVSLAPWYVWVAGIFHKMQAKMIWNRPPETNIDPNIMVSNRNLCFQAPIFRCHVSFWGSLWSPFLFIRRDPSLIFQSPRLLHRMVIHPEFDHLTILYLAHLIGDRLIPKQPLWVDSGIWRMWAPLKVEPLAGFSLSFAMFTCIF